MGHHTRRAANELCIALVALTLTLPMATAAEDDALTTAVKACAAIRKNAERLACYDSRVYPLATGAAAAAPPTPSAEEVFGAESSVVATPAQQEAKAPPEREELSKITAHVTAISTLPRGELQIELDNGQVWRQVDPHELLLHTGDSVTIARAALGTFRMTTSTGRVSKVQRVR
jgi:hypothetical protein